MIFENIAWIAYDGRYICMFYNMMHEAVRTKAYDTADIIKAIYNVQAH